METPTYWTQGYPNSLSQYSNNPRSRTVDIGEHKLALPVQTTAQHPLERFNDGENALPMGLVPNPVHGYQGLNISSMPGLNFSPVEQDAGSWHSSLRDDDQRSSSADSSASSTQRGSISWHNTAISGYRSNSIAMAFQEQPEATYYYKPSTEVIDPNLTLNNQEPDMYGYKEPTIKFEFPCFLPLEDAEYEHEPCSPQSSSGTSYSHYEHDHSVGLHVPLPNFNNNWGARKVPVTRSQSHNDNQSQSQTSSRGSGSGARSNKSARTPLSPTSTKKIMKRRGSSSSSEESHPKPNNRPKTYKKKIPYYACEEEACKARRAIFKNKSELKKHTETQHTKPYICICGFANCTHRFGARNEWKRHIATQHLMLFKYVCDHQDCVEKNKAKTVFNRADLFMKHQERMHSPFDIYERSPDDLEVIAWRKEMKDTRKRCETLRTPPQRMTCGFCSAVFQHGDRTWNELTDHVGLHYQANDESVQNGYKDDLDLMAWMKENNLIKSEEDAMDVESETPSSRKSRKHSYASSSSTDSSSARQIKQEHMEF
ncbi:hypothetical protein H072_9033 [Dactylellina haptotyla CBS 200.50]|uniref:C2H2-type domain-containing protein n=1 Tax=Dactylellina haptotyla (strain CBS 200.50) TaxID=1284197 RepID=S8A3B7_DACHA|nr:hypothetical protein H072_9033 [Dactylellina haptotyla CBS 200.50]